MPWNASGQPIGKGIKPPTPMDNNSGGGANFWDDVIGVSNNKINGGSNNQRGQSKKGGMRYEGVVSFAFYYEHFSNHVFLDFN